MADQPQTGTLPIGQAALLLMISEERIRQLQKASYIPRSEKGRVPLVGAVQGYIRFLKDDERRASKTAADSRVRDARAREIELRTAKEEAELVPFDEAQHFVNGVIGLFMSLLNGMPAEFTRDVDERRRLEAILDRVRSQVDAKLAELSLDYRRGPPADPAGGKDEPEPLGEG